MKKSLIFYVLIPFSIHSSLIENDDLHNAIEDKDLNKVQEILRKNPKVNYVKDGVSAISLAAKQCDSSKILRELVSSNKEQLMRDSLASLNIELKMVNYRPINPLSVAANYGCLENVKILLSYGDYISNNLNIDDLGKDIDNGDISESNIEKTKQYLNFVRMSDREQLNKIAKNAALLKKRVNDSTGLDLDDNVVLDIVLSTDPEYKIFIKNEKNLSLSRDDTYENEILDLLISYYNALDKR